MHCNLSYFKVLAKNVSARFLAIFYFSKQMVIVNLQCDKINIFLSLIGEQARSKEDLIFDILTAPNIKLYCNQNIYCISQLEDV